MSKESEADRRRHDSIYEREEMVPEQLLHDLANAPILPESEIETSHAGTLTPSQTLIVSHLSHGLNMPMIAEVEGKTQTAVAWQVKEARAALNAKTVAHLVAIALRQGLID